MMQWGCVWGHYMRSVIGFAAMLVVLASLVPTSVGVFSNLQCQNVCFECKSSVKGHLTAISGYLAEIEPTHPCSNGYLLWQWSAGWSWIDRMLRSSTTSLNRSILLPIENWLRQDDLRASLVFLVVEVFGIAGFLWWLNAKRSQNGALRSSRKPLKKKSRQIKETFLDFKENWDALTDSEKQNNDKEKFKEFRKGQTYKSLEKTKSNISELSDLVIAAFQLHKAFRLDAAQNFAAYAIFLNEAYRATDYVLRRQRIKTFGESWEDLKTQLDKLEKAFDWKSSAQPIWLNESRPWVSDVSSGVAIDLDEIHSIVRSEMAALVSQEGDPH
jgi:hypothetical protein